METLLNKSTFRRYVVMIAALAAPLCSGACMSVESRPNNNASAMVHKLNESDNGRAVELHPGEKVRITLPENATTGFRWQVERFDRDVIGIVAEEPHYPSGPPGAGGHIELIVEGRKPGTSELVLKHWRDWEGDSSIIARFHLNVKVLP